MFSVVRTDPFVQFFPEVKVKEGIESAVCRMPKTIVAPSTNHLSCVGDIRQRWNSSLVGQRESTWLPFSNVTSIVTAQLMLFLLFVCILHMSDSTYSHSKGRQVVVVWL